MGSIISQGRKEVKDTEAKEAPARCEPDGFPEELDILAPQSSPDSSSGYQLALVLPLLWERTTLLSP